MSYRQHQRFAHHAQPRVRVGILTASDSRDFATDESGRWLERALAKKHDVVGRHVVPDDVKALRRVADDLLDFEADVLIVNGGTGPRGSGTTGSCGGSGWFCAGTR